MQSISERYKQRNNDKGKNATTTTTTTTAHTHTVDLVQREKFAREKKETRKRQTMASLQQQKK